MDIFERQIKDYERLVFARDEACGYRGIIAIHNTALGPAVGGTRLWNYASDTEALKDVLRLARGMTYKNALAGLPFGGGKSIIIDDGRTINREAIFRAHGRAARLRARGLQSRQRVASRGHAPRRCRH